MHEADVTEAKRKSVDVSRPSSQQQRDRQTAVNNNSMHSSSMMSISLPHNNADTSSFAAGGVVVDDPNAKVNPFFYDAESSSGVLQWLKMAIVGITLFPIRILLFVLILVVAWIICKLMTIGVSDAQLLERPLHRPILRFLFRKCARIAMWCLGFWWIHRSGVEHIEREWHEAMREMQQRSGAGEEVEGTAASGDIGHNGEVPPAATTTTTHPSRTYRAPILVSNHSALVDTMYLAAYHDFMAVGKAELLDLPLFGGICRALQYIPVRRDSADSRKEVSREIRRRAQPQLPSEVGGAQWPQLVIFPEATCTNTRAIIQFKLGAFVPCAPVQPMTLRYPYRHLMLDWVGPATLHGLILKSMLQVYNSMHVSYLPIHFPTASERSDITTFAQHVRESIAHALDVPMTEHTFEDVQLINEALALQVPFLDDVNIAMGLPQNQSFGLDRAKQKLREFAALDTNGDGRLSREEFGSLLGLNALGSDGKPDMAKRAIRDAIFNRWLANGRKGIHNNSGKSGGRGVHIVALRADGEDTIDFATFLACTAANKIRLRMRTRRSASGACRNHDDGEEQPLGSQKSFFLDEAKDEEVLYCVSLCFGSFDRDHDGSISREEFHQGMALVCPSLDDLDLLHKSRRSGGWTATDGLAAHDGTDRGSLPRPTAPSIDIHGAVDGDENIPEPSSSDVINQLFDEVDSSKDGMLQLDEFVMFAKSHPAFLNLLLETFEAHNLLVF